MSKIILITGGQRSGKSAYAERLALRLSPTPTYLATARVLDDDMQQRVNLHKARRGPNWTNIEEPMLLSRHDLNNRVVLIDCVTLWATNFLFHFQETTPDDPHNSLANKTFLALAKEFESLSQQDATLIFVTNEIGLGGTSNNALQRLFTDVQGLINQYIAQRAEQVVLLVSGIPVTIKPSQPPTL